MREEIIQKVNECSQKILSDIDSYEKDFKLNLSRLDSKLKSNETLNLLAIKADLTEWSKKVF